MSLIHYLRILTKNPNFLLTGKLERDENDDTIIHTLPCNEVEEFKYFNKTIKNLLRIENNNNPYIKKGINLYQVNKNGKNINVSFINSLIQLVEENNDTFTVMNNITQLLKENYCNRNNNSPKNKTITNRMIENLNNGIVMDDFINRIASIYLVNILIFDNISESFKFHLSVETFDMYNYINLFRPIIIMTVSNGNYEPIIRTITNDEIYKTHRRSLYVRILMDTKIQLCFTEDNKLKDRYKGVMFHPTMVTYFNTWTEYNMEEYMFIINRMSNREILKDDIKQNKIMIEGLSGNRRFIEIRN